MENYFSKDMFADVMSVHNRKFSLKISLNKNDDLYDRHYRKVICDSYGCMFDKHLQLSLKSVYLPLVRCLYKW